MGVEAHRPSVRRLTQLTVSCVSVLTKRPLLDTAADQALFVSDESRSRVVRDALLDRNTLIVGDAGSGKTSLLYRIRAGARESSRSPAVLMVNAQHADTGRDLVDLILHEAENEDWLEDATRPAHDDPFGPVAQIRRLAGAPDHSLVLIDDPDPGQALTLFGRLRDELFQITTRFAVTVTPATFRRINKPPADVFFDTVIELEPLDADAAFELLRVRKERGEIPGQVLWPTRPMHPRAILLDAQAGPVGRRHDRALQAHLTGLAKQTAGPTGAGLLAEIWGRGALSASDPDLQRSLGVTRARLTQLLKSLERAEVLISFPQATPRAMGRPKTLYDINATR